MNIIVHEPINISPESQHAEREQITTLMKKMDELTAANKSTNDQLISLVNDHQTIQRTIVSLKEENTSLKNENAALKEETAKMKSSVSQIFDDMDYALGKLQQIEQNAISNNIEISGVPMVEDEDLSAVLHRLFEQVDFQFSSNVIKDAYRTKPNKKSGLPGSIIATFDSFNSKQQFVMKTKGKNITSEFVRSTHIRPVYINDHLTKMNRYLFYLARCMRRKGQIKYAWVDSGKVLVKKSDGMESVVVECPKTLDNLVTHQ
jgi:cell division protein FtsB